MVRAARIVFGRDGYARASIDAIAAEAGVSTRTVYNHFAGKGALFSFVIRESATQVADALTALIVRHLSDADDLERDLAALGRDWAAVMTAFAAHFAMVRQIATEAGHFPPSLLAAWDEAGPRRVETELARHMRVLIDRGVLREADAARAADHFLLLTVGDIASRTSFGAAPLDKAEVAEIVSDGVHAFLYGYLPRSKGGSRGPTPPTVPSASGE